MKNIRSNCYTPAAAKVIFSSPAINSPQSVNRSLRFGCYYPGSRTNVSEARPLRRATVPEEPLLTRRLLTQIEKDGRPLDQWISRRDAAYDDRVRARTRGFIIRSKSSAITIRCDDQSNIS